MSEIKIIECNISNNKKILFIISGLDYYDGEFLLAEQLMKKLTNNNYKKYFNPIPSFDFRNEKISMHNSGIDNYYDDETYLWILYEDAEKYIPIIKNFINEVENSTKINTINLIIDAFGNEIIRGNFK